MTSEPNYIHGITIVNNRVDQNLEIDLTPDPGQAFKHLILTGKNGSGKTSTLSFLRKDLSNADGRVMMSHNWQTQPSMLGLFTNISPNPSYHFDDTRTLFMEARRQQDYRPVKGPTTGANLADPGDLEQHLVNLRTYIAYANEEGDTDSANLYRERLNSYENTLQELFEYPDLRLEFNREKMSYKIVLRDEPVKFSHLPDGFSSALHIWSSVYALCQRSEDNWGIVIIDEIEAHLHLSLQERLLPFLTASFPRIQFIVATHSPAVIASIDGAIVYDLSSHTAVRSEDLRGLSYGTIMMGHFGISSDIDLKTTAELVELKALHEKESRTADEEDRLRSLARRLAEKSHVLALKIWNELEFGAA